MKITGTLMLVCFGLAGCTGTTWVPDVASSYPFTEGSSRVVLYQLGDERCRLEGTLPPMNVDRELEITGEMDGEYKSDDSLGVLVVKVGGFQVIGSSLRKSQNVLQDGRMVGEKRHWVRSNETIRVVAEGEVNGGRCMDLRVRIRDSVTQTAAAE
jgi:hypothetical protein